MKAKTDKSNIYQGPTAFKERFEFWYEYDTLLDRAIEMYRSLENGDADGIAEGALHVFPTIVFIRECLARYKFATSFITEDDIVVDIPCGTGYGTAMLASTGANVSGIDIDRDTISVCKAEHKYHNVSFIVGDMLGRKLPPADVFICFEGIEHTDGKTAVSNMYNALSDGGRFIASVPINELYITRGVRNPYHTTDYDVPMFIDLIKSHFDSNMFFGIDPYGGITDIRNAWKGVVSVSWK